MSDILGVAVLILSALTWLKVRQMENRRIATLRDIQATPGTRPGVLSIAVGPEPIDAQVKGYVSQQPWGSKSSGRVADEHVHYKGQLSPDSMEAILDEFRRKRITLLEQGCDCIHLFVKAPLPLALVVGAELGNGCLTQLYHLNSQKGYEPWGPLYRRLPT